MLTKRRAIYVPQWLVCVILDVLSNINLQTNLCIGCFDRFDSRILVDSFCAASSGAVQHMGLHKRGGYLKASPLLPAPFLLAAGLLATGCWLGPQDPGCKM